MGRHLRHMNPKQTIRISASILAADFSNLGEAVRDVESAGVDSIHVDFMDGHYVHNFSFGIDLLAALRPHTSLPLVAHLEIENPDQFVADFAGAGADMIIVCEDTCPHPEATLGAIRAEGVQAGVSLNPDRPLHLVREYVDQLDMLLILGVLPGFGGQKFLSSVLPKIAEARNMIDAIARPTALAVDGGINLETVTDVVRAGADTLIMGSAVYRGNVKENVQTLRSLVTPPQLSARGQ